jgi:hypothetical protein
MVLSKNEVIAMKLWKIYLGLSLLSIGYGVGSFFYEANRTEKAEFAGLPMTPELKKAPWFFQGQCETKGKGFYAGKKVKIYIMGTFSDTNMFNQFRDMAHFTRDCVFVADSTTPTFSHPNFPKALNNPRIGIGRSGNLSLEFNDLEKSFTATGDVCFVREGDLNLGPPFEGFFWPVDKTLQSYIHIDPSSVGDQIETNRIMLLLTFVTMGVAFISLANDAKASQREKRR